jgi:CRP-like cAMP-binding protein
LDRLDYFRLFHDIPTQDYELLRARLGRKSFEKGENIIVPGQVQRELYFVNEGVQMSYFDLKEKPQVIAFTYPPNLCAIPESFQFQAPSKYFLSCLTHSEMESISFDALQDLFDKSQHIERLFRKMTEAVLAGVLNRHVELHSLTIEERFRAFCRRSPQLLQLVPHKLIASYLGIDPTNFSKLYNRIKI